MQHIRFNSAFVMILAMMTCSAFAGFACLGQSKQQPGVAAPIEGSLKTFLQDYLKKPRLSDDETTRYFDANVDLNDDGKQEIIVYIMGRRSCGSGGCNTLVLAREGSSYRVVTNITISRPPIRALSKLSHGWRSLTVWVQGGGILPGYEAELPFDGTSYPSNPSVLPARRLTQGVSGEIVLPESTNDIRNGKPLYP